jgi:hypothetical protein
MQTAKGIIAIINAFEDALNSKTDWKPSFNKLIALGENAVYIIGQYFHQGGKVSNGVLWIYLFQEFQIKDYPIPSKEIDTWIQWSKRQYLDCVKNYSRLSKETTEYMEGFNSGVLSYNNSSHRQTAVSKYEWFLKEAEKLFDTTKIKEIKEKIHFLQAG